MPGKASSHWNGEDPCRSQSTSTQQRASPQAACMAWKLQPGGKWRAANLPWEREESQSCWSWWGREHKEISLHYLLGKRSPEESVEEALAPWQEGCRLGLTWGWLQGGDPGLWDVALQPTEGWQKGQGSRSPRWQRGGKCRWAVVGTQGDNLHWELPLSGELFRVSCTWVQGCRSVLGTSGALIFFRFNIVLEMFMLGTKTKRFIFSLCFCQKFLWISYPKIIRDFRG